MISELRTASLEAKRSLHDASQDVAGSASNQPGINNGHPGDDSYAQLAYVPSHDFGQEISFEHPREQRPGMHEAPRGDEGQERYEVGEGEAMGGGGGGAEEEQEDDDDTTVEWSLVSSLSANKAEEEQGREKQAEQGPAAAPKKARGKLTTTQAEACERAFNEWGGTCRHRAIQLEALSKEIGVPVSLRSTLGHHPPVPPHRMQSVIIILVGE
jgi:hypothetical protein